MKKTLILIMIFAVVNIYKSNAQQFYIGANGGFLKNAMIIEDYSSTPQYLQLSRDKERLNTYNWGINFGYKLTDRWSLEAQLQFLTMSFKERLDLIYGFQNDSMSFSVLREVDWYHKYYYTRLPILLHYNFFSTQSKYGVSLFAGPNIGLLTHKTSKFIGINNDFSSEMTDDLNIEDIPLKKMDFGLQLGVRVQAKIYQSFSLFAEGTIYQGFPSIINYPKQTYDNSRGRKYYEDLNIVNRHFTTSIGVLYNF